MLRFSGSVKASPSSTETGVFFKEHAAATEDRVLRSVFCAALARVPGAIDDDFVQMVRKKMAADEWTYFLFEVGRNADGNRSVLTSVLGDRQLRPVDRVLCAWGLGILDKRASRSTPDEIGEPESAEIVEALLKSDDKKEVELGIALCAFVDISESKLAEIMFDFIDRSTDRAVKVRGIEQLGLLSNEQAWKRMRAFAAQGRHSDVRREFELAEKRIRDNISSMRNRRSWNEVKSDRGLRDNMWRLLR